jgi:hypothetical protein
VWSLYATYTWTAQPSGNTLQVVRFCVPALGAMALLGAWLVVRVPRRASVAALTSAAVVAAAFGLGVWSYNGMREGGLPAVRILHGVWLPLGGRVGPAAEVWGRTGEVVGSRQRPTGGCAGRRSRSDRRRGGLRRRSHHLALASGLRRDRRQLRGELDRYGHHVDRRHTGR